MVEKSWNEHHWIESADAAIQEVRLSVKAADWKRGPSGGHGERSVPSVDELFDEALK